MQREKRHGATGEQRCVTVHIPRSHACAEEYSQFILKTLPGLKVALTLLPTAFYESTHMTHFTCPYCDRDQAVVASKASYHVIRFSLEENAEGRIGAGLNAISCSNESCRQTTVIVQIGNVALGSKGGYYLNYGTTLFSQRLLPQGSVRVFPDYIPNSLLEDYREACLIRDLSPKASATLVRRCIQGMIRDFCKISKATLNKEIEALKALVNEGKAPQGVTIETVEAIDHVRGIGNIGAHMEKDIDVIIPVEPDEAELLISLVEMLFQEWYVARNIRENRLASIKQISVKKEQAKKALPVPEDAGSDLGAIRPSS